MRIPSRQCRGVKVLVGTPVTCLKGDDEKTWGSSLGKDNNFKLSGTPRICMIFVKSGWTKEFLAMVGPKHVMGLAIGNELELLHNHVPWRAKRFRCTMLSRTLLVCLRKFLPGIKRVPLPLLLNLFACFFFFFFVFFLRKMT